MTAYLIIMLAFCGLFSILDLAIFIAADTKDQAAAGGLAFMHLLLLAPISVALGLALASR